jgi:hypothetical protein
MLSHDPAQRAAERFGLTQLGKSLFWITRYQCAPDWHALFDVACLTQRFDGIVVNRGRFQEVVEEPIDNAGPM